MRVRVFISYLWWFVDGADASSDAERDLRVLFVDAVHESGALISGSTPVI